MAGLLKRSLDGSAKAATTPMREARTRKMRWRYSRHILPDHQVILDRGDVAIKTAVKWSFVVQLRTKILLSLL